MNAGVVGVALHWSWLCMLFVCSTSVCFALNACRLYASSTEPQQTLQPTMSRVLCFQILVVLIHHCIVQHNGTQATTAPPFTEPALFDLITCRALVPL